MYVSYSWGTQSVTFIEENYSNRNQYNDKFESGLSSNMSMGAGNGAQEFILNMDEQRGSCYIVNMGAFKRWGGRSLTVLEPFSIEDPPISQDAFKSDYGKNYSNQYSSYDEYLERNLVKVPANTGAVS